MIAPLRHQHRALGRNVNRMRKILAAWDAAVVSGLNRGQAVNIAHGGERVNDHCGVDCLEVDVIFSWPATEVFGDKVTTYLRKKVNPPRMVATRTRQ